MKVSYNWLNNFVDKKLPPVGDVANALMFHSFEVEGVEKVADDNVLDIKVLQRGHDCLGHRGVAKELSAILRLPFNVQHDPFAKKSDFSKKASEVGVNIATPLCTRYIAAHIKGVKVGPSPEWLKASLEALGQRSINNVVDATNLVMFNIGQPMHAFDAGKLVNKNGYAISVRTAKAGEKMLALDGKEYVLTESILVISDENAGEAIGVAGVKGGMPAAITEETTEIILEAANFDGATVRRAAQALKLRTDASVRFEQRLSSELAAYGMQQAVAVIAAIAGGELQGFVDVYPAPEQPRSAPVSVEKINKVLGITLTPADVADVFSRLGFAYKEESGIFDVQIPFERLDLAISEDLVEEVGRIIGYDRIPATVLPSPMRPPEINKAFAAAQYARKELDEKGYSEILTSVFAEKGERVVLNKVDGIRPYLRDSLLPGLSDALKKNIPNKDLLGLKEIQLFEIGTVWKDGKEITMLGTISEKEKRMEKPLQEAYPNVDSYVEIPVSTLERFAPFSRYPYIVRDISMWVPQGQEERIDVIFKIFELFDPDLLIRKKTLVDQFKKADKTSLSFRLVFQSFERTLTEIEVNAIMEKVATALKAKGFEIR